MAQMSALSIRQPYAELILRGQKKIEYRSRATRKRGQVFIYASKTPGNSDDFQSMNLAPIDLPTGVIVGTIEIIDCRYKINEYKWFLANPKRLKKSILPKKHPQPVWFYPF